MKNKIEYEWTYKRETIQKELDKTAFTILMEAIKLNYPYNNTIATKLSEVLPNTKKIIVDRDRAEENPENAFIICVLENGEVKAVKASLTNPIIWNMFKEWGEGK